MAIVPASADVLISVNKSDQRMTVAVDGVPRYMWPVSTGRAGYDTPSGSFQTFRMEEDHFSKEFDDAPMPHSIFFTKIGHAIHGSYDVKHLGTAYSHGCVRISPEHAATLYALVKAEGLFKTKVVLTGTVPPAAPLVAARKPLKLQPQNDNVQPQDDEETTGYAPPGRVYGPYGSSGDMAGPPADVPNARQQPGWNQPTYGQQGYGQQGYGQQGNEVPVEQPRPRWPFPFFN